MVKGSLITHQSIINRLVNNGHKKKRIDLLVSDGHDSVVIQEALPQDTGEGQGCQ